MRTRIAVLGAGRMGRQLVQAVTAAEDLRLGGIWLRPGARFDFEPGTAPPRKAVISSDLQAVLAAADVAVDFSLPEATPQVLEAAVRSRTPLVCGVSGLADAEMLELKRAAEAIPLLYDRNMSVGIAVLKDAIGRAAPLLGESFITDIHETHHVHKKDAPSGTAIALGEVLAGSRGQELVDVMQYDPHGNAARRSNSDIVFSVTREGEVPGEHSVVFRSEAECLELTHRVTDRRVFAICALRAARWLLRQEPGFYRISDFLVNISP
ncbi:MAG: 4-hydroxy-tetrahydrodipicolinate reductase [Woeseia sp.]